MVSRFKYLFTFILVSIYLYSATSQKAYSTFVDSPKICFLRHGHTSWTWEMLAKGPKDLPLTKEGIQNVQKAANVIIQQSDFKPRIVFSSPHKRCLETAQIFQKKYKKIRGQGLAIKVIKDLRGPIWGSWSLDVTAQLTKKVEEIKDLDLSDEESNELMLKVVRETPQNNEESEQDFKARVGVALQNIINLQEGPFLVVAHGSVSRVLENYFSRWVTVKDSQWLHTFLMFGSLKDES